MNKKKLVNSTLAAIVSTGLLVGGVAQSAQAAVKCYGVAKAGKNDCGVPGKHACAGQSTINYDAKEWVFVKNQQTCDEMKAKVKQEQQQKKS